MSLRQYIMNTKKSLTKSKFAKSVLVITGSTVATQLLNMIFSPIITRIYLPEEYGVLALLSSILAILSFPSLRYEMAIPIAKEDDEAINVVALSAIILILFSVILTAILIFQGEQVLALFGATELSDYKYFVPLGVFLIGFHQILIQWMYRRKGFTLISKTRVAQNLVGNITKTGAGFLGLGVNGLLLGKIISQSASIIPLTKYVVGQEKRLFRKINGKNMVRSMKRFKAFPIYQTPSTFLSMFKNQLPVFSLALYGSHVVGLYGLANTIVKLPMTLVGHSVRNVFFAEAASIGKGNPQKLKALTNKLQTKLIVLGLFPLVALIAFGPQLFTFVFGSSWYGSGVLARFLALAVYADFIFSPVSRVYEVLERQKEKMIVDTIGLLLVFLAFVLARFLSDSANFAIALYSVAMSISYLITYIVARKYLNKEIRSQERLQP